MSADPPAAPDQAVVPEVADSASPSSAPTACGYSWGKFAFDAIFLMVVSIIACCANQELLKSTIIAPSSNDAMHLEYLATYINAIHSCDNLWQAVLTTWAWPCFYPPASYAVTCLYCQIFGNGIIPALTSLTVFIPIIFSAVYFTIRPKCGALAAIVAVLAVASVPQGLLCPPHYPSDLQVGLGAGLALCFLFRCDIFRQRGASLLFGLVFGYCLLFKSNVAWFVAPALAVLLIARWRDWLPEPLSVLWHLALFIGAFAVCTRTTTAFGESVHKGMIVHSTIVSPAVQIILGVVVGVVVLWWWLAKVSFRKLHRVPMLINLSHALSLTFLVSMPWILVNLALVQAQRGVFWDQLLSYSNPEQLQACARSIYSHSFGMFFSVLLGLALLFSLTKWASAYDRALSLSAVFGFAMTACSLGIAARYYFPCYLVSACCLAAPLRKSKVLACIAIVMGILGFTCGLILQSCPNLREKSDSIIYRLGGTSRSGDYVYGPSNTNECVFSKVWQICPAMADSDGKPRLVILNQDYKRVKENPKTGEFGFEVMEDASNAISAWSSWHNSCLIPIYIRHQTNFFCRDRYTYVQFVDAANKLKPELGRTLQTFLVEPDQAKSDEAQSALMAMSSYLIDLNAPYTAALTAQEVAEIMRCPNPVHYQVRMENCTLHLWSRPETSPDIGELNLKANRLAPHIDWINVSQY